MSSLLSNLRTLFFAGIIIVTTVGPAAAAAEVDSVEQLTWLRANTCSRAERSTGLVDVEGECVRDHPAFGDDVIVCAGHFCPAHPGEPGARIIHPLDFGPTD